MSTKIYDIFKVQYGYFTDPLMLLEPTNWYLMFMLSNGSHNSEATTHFISSSSFAYKYILHICKFAFITCVLLWVMHIRWFKSLKKWENWKEKKRMMHLGTSRTSVRCIMGNMESNSGFRGVVSQIVLLFFRENQLELRAKIFGGHSFHDIDSDGKEFFCSSGHL